MLLYVIYILSCLFHSKSLPLLNVNSNKMTAIKILFPFYYWISNTAMDAMGMKMLLDIVEKLNK